MKHIKIILIILSAILLATSCGTKRKYVNVETKKSDTLVLKTEVIKAPVLNDTFTLKEICEDSVVTEFERIFVRDTDTIILRLQDNSLNVRIAQQERVLTKMDSVVQKREESILKLERTVKSRTSFRVFLILVGIIVLLWVFPGIPSSINGFIKKIIFKV